MTIKEFTLEDLHAVVAKIKGIVKRYNLLTQGMVECADGEFVTYVDHYEQTERLKKKIKQLEFEASREYIKGYDAGRYAGPEYNMRND